MMWKLTFKHLTSRPFLLILTLAAIVGSLSVLGIFWTVSENLQRVQLSQISSFDATKPASATLFIDPKLSTAQIDALKESISKTEAVQSVQLVTSTEALKLLEAQFGQTLSKVFEGDSLPITMKVVLKATALNREELAAVFNSLRSHQGVLDLDDGLAVVPGEQTSMSHRVFSWTTALLLVIFAVVALLVSHLIRMAFETLRGEIETLKILGASKLWLFLPLALEGLVLGLMGIVGALFVVQTGVTVVIPKFSSTLLPTGVQFFALSTSATLQLVGVSLGAGLIGALATWPLVAAPAKEFS